MIRTIDARQGDVAELVSLRRRTLEEVSPDVENTVRSILADVRDRGDAAVVDHTRRFDCPTFTLEQLRVDESEIDRAYEQVPSRWITAFVHARDNIAQFQERAKCRSWLDTFDGLTMGHRVTPVASAGVYAPARNAPLPSSLCAAAVPAKVAGVSRIVLATPPRDDGSVDPTMLVAARECGVDEVFRMGGAQAVAALAYGTQTIKPVLKVVGPGPSWVQVAKKLAFGLVGIESLAGPSESLIVADASATPELVAADMLTQAEHTGDNATLLVTDSEDLATRVQTAIESQLAGLPRAQLTRRSLEQHSYIVITATIEQAVEIANDIAPEHLQILTQRPFDVLEAIRNAGCIFLGDRAPVPFGDYAAGPSHVLPTYGTARFSSPLSVNDFLTVSSVIYANARGFDRLADDVVTLANAEGLDAHAETIRLRQRMWE